MARGVDGRETFTDDRDRQLFLTALAELKAETRFSLLAYCLMGNHFHLAIKVGHIPLSSILQRLLTRYALTFNSRHDRTGHLFQARYKAVLCTDDAYLVRLIEYIHANPVRAGFVASAESWRWSSAALYAENRGTELVDPIDLPAALGLTDHNQAASCDFDPWPTTESSPVLLRAPVEERASLESLAGSISTHIGLPIETLRSKRKDRETIR
jgi:REP element-mobilizing transposase RayT